MAQMAKKDGALSDSTIAEKYLGVADIDLENRRKTEDFIRKIPPLQLVDAVEYLEKYGDPEDKALKVKLWFLKNEVIKMLGQISQGGQGEMNQGGGPMPRPEVLPTATFGQPPATPEMSEAARAMTGV